MKIAIIALLLCLIIPGVLAASIGVPENMETIEYLDVGDEITYTFFLRGGSEEEDIQFFMKPLGIGGVVSINGVDSYSKNYNLEPFEELYIDVDVEGEKAGISQVEWGYKYISDSTGEGVGFEQAMVERTRFVVDQDDSDNDDEEVDVEVNTDDTSTSTSGGAGGGGGGGGAGGAGGLLEEEQSAGDDAADAANMQDISAQGSPTAEMVAQDSGSGPEPVKRSVGLLEANESVATSKEGKMEFTLVIVLAVLTMGLSFASYRAVKEDEE